MADDRDRRPGRYVAIGEEAAAHHGMPIVVKKSGLTMRQSIGTGVSGGSGDLPIAMNGVVL